jgi:predicted ATPase/DNA-binding CsgD family transcriptional regulator
LIHNSSAGFVLIEMGLTNLPIQLTSFIGREQEITNIKRLLFTSRLVTLTGAGGSGKTRLAIQIANEVSESFADGVWFVDLASLHDPALVPNVVAQVLGFLPTADQPLMEMLLEFARSKHLLLILDNCEHLTEACAQLAKELLSKSPELRILATSREPLAIAGESIYPVSGLSCPSSHESVEGNPDELMRYDAVRLFVERARAISPDFRLTLGNAVPIGEICCRLDGLPLALELASARVQVLTVHEIAARLNDRFALLTSAQHKGLEHRHHTLRAAIDWSYDLLQAREQALLRHMAVFEAGCTLDILEALCSGDVPSGESILDLISSLVKKSLVVAETSGRTQVRCRLLETIREYLMEKLDEASETATWRDRHLYLFLGRAEEAAPKLNDAYQKLWLNWLEGEHDNLRAALAWSLESGQIEAGLRIGIAIARFWEIRGYVPEGMVWFERLLARAGEGLPRIVHAQALAFAGFMAMFLGNAPACIAYGHEAAALAEKAGDDGNPILILALNAAGSGARMAGDYQTAFDLDERTIQLLRASPGPTFFLGMSLMAGGDVAMELGAYDKARVLLNESLALAQEAGDAFRIAHTFNTLGDLARYQGNYTEAKSYYEKSVALLREIGAGHDLAAFVRNLGRACLLLGDVERAGALFRESLAAHQAEQNKSGMTECLIGLAAVAVLRGYPAAGVRLLAAAVALRGQRASSVWPAKRMEIDQFLDMARARLSEAEFQAEQAAGHALSLEQAVEYAQNLSFKSEITPEVRKKPDSLTGREREVTALIGQGKTNNEIANELVLSKRTVEKHVGNILSKLGLTSRSQIVRWFMEHGVTQISE